VAISEEPACQQAGISGGIPWLLLTREGQNVEKN